MCLGQCSWHSVILASIRLTNNRFVKLPLGSTNDGQYDRATYPPEKSARGNRSPYPLWHDNFFATLSLPSRKLGHAVIGKDNQVTHQLKQVKLPSDTAGLHCSALLKIHAASRNRAQMHVQSSSNRQMPRLREIFKCLRRQETAATPAALVAWVWAIMANIAPISAASSFVTCSSLGQRG